MRAIVIVLALFAAVKIGAQEYLFRSSARDVIVAAYRERAIQACQVDARSAATGVGAAAWAKPSDVRLMIGKPTLDVHLWQVDHELWNARFRHPYIVVSPAAGAPAGVVCEYDVVQKSVMIQRL